MEQNKEYFAFISYQRQDEEWAKWLAHELEHYHFPVTLNGRTDLPKDLRPIFRDVDELSAGNLPEQIHRALSCSKHLIVICSPNSAQSPWVNKEIEEFISMGRTDRIFPFIIDGKAFAKNPEEECFPLALRTLPKEDERLGGNINEMGRDAAVVKTVAGMLDLEFDTLWQRYEREKAEEERKIKEQRDSLLIAQSRFLAEKANGLIDDGDTYTAKLLALEALPGDLQNPNRPLVGEAEQALRRAVSTEQLLFEGHKDGVRTVVFSPDGKYVVSGSMDESIRIWDTVTGTLVGSPLFAHTDSVESLAFSPDGKLLASATDTGEIIIWDFDTRTIVFKFPHTKANSPIAFSPDGKQLVTATSNYSLQKWEPLTGNPVGEAMKGHKDVVSALCYSHDGRLIASASWDKSIIIWDEKTNRLVMEPLVGHAERDNSHGGEDCTPRFKVYGHMAYINTIAFSPDDMWIASGAWDKTICQWSVKTGKPMLSSIGHTGEVTSVIYAPDNKIIASGSSDGTIRFWDADNGRTLLPPLRGHKNGITCIAYSPDGKHIASASYDKSVWLWSVQEKEPAPLLFEGHEESVECAAFSPDGSMIASVSSDLTARLWDAKTQKEILPPLKGHTEDLTSVTFSPDGQTIATASWDHTVRVWNVNTGVLAYHPLEGHKEGVRCVKFSPDGMLLATGSNDGTIRLWRTSDGALAMEPIPCLVGNILSIAFSPDGRYLVVGGSLEKFVVLGTSTGCVELGPLEGQDFYVSAVTYSPNGDLIASASYEKVKTSDGNTKRMPAVRLWNSITGELYGSPIFGHTNDILSVQFSPDGCYLLTASKDESARIWEIATGKEVFCMQHPWFVNSASFNSNGTRIVTSCADNKLRIWSYTPLQTLINLTKERFKDRQLTPEEREKYYLD